MTKANFAILDYVSQACHVWNDKLEFIGCNKASLRLFGASSKEDFVQHFYDYSPLRQENGELSTTLAQRYILEAFKVGELSFDWIHQDAQGMIFPCQVVLRRVEVDDQYFVVVSIKETIVYHQMLATIKHQKNLQDVVSKAAGILLTDLNKDTISAAITQGLGYIGEYLGLNRVSIWELHRNQGTLAMSLCQGWQDAAIYGSDRYVLNRSIPVDIRANWVRTLSMGGVVCLNMNQESLGDFDVIVDHEQTKALLMIPIINDDKPWGNICFSSNIEERHFSDEEILILDSVSKMIHSALMRVRIGEETLEQTKMVLDSSPFSCLLWNQNRQVVLYNHVAETYYDINKNMSLCGVTALILGSFPDSAGENSTDYYLDKIEEAFRQGSAYYKGLRVLANGSITPMDITMHRIPYGDDFVVASYARDLREQNRMLAEIYQRDSLLNAVNQVAKNLLSSNLENFTAYIQECLGLLATAASADRTYMRRNEEHNQQLVNVLDYLWCNDYAASLPLLPNLLSYERDIPFVVEPLSNNRDINTLTKDLPPLGRALVGATGAKAVLIMPLIVEGYFWGTLSFDYCQNERIFSDNEVSILRSGALLIANSLLHKEHLLTMQENSVRLAEALEIARDANTAKTAFLANMSHEMRTPLNAVIGLSELILGGNNIDGGTREKLEQVHNSGTLLLNLVNDILDISKIEAGKLDVVPEEYELASLLNDVIGQNMLRKADKPIEFRLDIDERLPSNLYGDSRRLKQIISNLLSNAFKYTDAGTVTLSLSGEVVDIQNQDILLTLQVKDTGVGIKEEDLATLFRDYTRLDLRRNRKQEGTGLGLAITHKLAELMGGSIEVSSVYRQGSTFTVQLHQKFLSNRILGKDIVENLREFRYVENKRNQSERLHRVPMPYANLLVVDDNLTNLYVVQGMLKPYQIKVDCVTNGRQAVETIRARQVTYDAIFMDHMMPEMDGVEATRKIRQEIPTDYAKNIPIIAFTANAVRGSEEMFLANGFQGFLSKPVEIIALDRILHRFVRDKEQEAKVAVEIPLHEKTPENNSFSNLFIHGMDMEEGLERFGGDEDSYISVLQSYAHNTMALLEKITIVNEANLKDYGIIVHGIKSSSFGIGAQLIGERARELEMAAKEGDLRRVEAYNGSFIKETHELIANIQKKLEELRPAQAKKTVEKPDEALLKELSQACAAYDMDAVDAILSELDQYDYQEGSDLIIWLQENVMLMNFDQIVARLAYLT